MQGYTFGQRIVFYRTKANLKQKELAESIGVTPTVLNYYEKDKREPNVAVIIKIARALGITGDELLGLDDLEPSRTVITDKDEIRFFNKYRQLSNDGKLKAEGAIEYILTGEMTSSSSSSLIQKKEKII